MTTNQTPHTEPNVSSPGVGSKFGSAVGQDPNLAISSAKKTVVTQIIGPQDMNVCSFWIGLFHEGSLSPTDLWASNNLYDAFETAAVKGLSEAGPLMLSDSNQVPARFIYLLPEPASESEGREEWLKQIVETLKTWGPERVGIYLSPQLIKKDKSHAVLVEILTKLIINAKTKEYFVLPGKHGTTSILNALLRLRGALSKQIINCFVFH